MKNPILRVRKGARVYDDDQEEQSAPPRAPGPLPGRGGRRPARRGRMTFLPLLVLALALVVVFRVIPRAPTNRAVIGGWTATLHAAPYQEALLVNVTFVRGGSSGETGAVENGPEAKARILLPDTGQEITLSGTLVRSPITLRGQMDYSLRVTRIQAEVSVGGETKTLRLSARARSR